MINITKNSYNFIFFIYLYIRLYIIKLFSLINKIISKISFKNRVIFKKEKI